jgi:hypothetical protein
VESEPAVSRDSNLRDALDLAAARLEQVEQLTARVEEQRRTIEGLAEVIRNYEAGMTQAHHEWRQMQELRMNERFLRRCAEDAIRTVIGKPRSIAWDPANEDDEFKALIRELLAWKASQHGG